MQVTTKTSVDFPKLGWGINAGEVRELPDNEEARKQILSNPDISEVKPKKEKQARSED